MLYLILKIDLGLLQNHFTHNTNVHHNDKNKFLLAEC